MYPHWHHAYRCGRTTSRLFWFAVGAGAATWWHCHHDARAWHQARVCWRDRIPQNAYPAPGSLPPPPPPSSPSASPAPTANQPPSPPEAANGQPQNQGGRDKWGWGPWGRDSRAQQSQQQQQPGQETQSQSKPGWGPWGRDNKQDGAWGPPMPVPGTFERPGQGEKDIVQQATETITELSEATLNQLLVTIESLKSKLAEHRAQREQQERELQALREAKFRQFEEWQRQLQEQQAQQAREERAKSEPPRRLV
ncbi:hypothetical protein BD414DRAFT_478373 [Trametes punicea]|nr:hypothetical protein BD414DRAFT_478373 [Trametes punicea]